MIHREAEDRSMPDYLPIAGGAVLIPVGVALIFYGGARIREFGIWSLVIAALGNAAILAGIFLYGPS